MKRILFLAALSVVCSVASAKDYGVQANVWPITEVDIRQLLVESASRVDWQKTNETVRDAGKNYLSNLPKRQLPEVAADQTVYFDPSIVLTSDIQAPIKQKDGSYKWEIFAAKGTKVNPLEKYRPVSAFLVFDGSQEEQREMVRQVLALEPNRIVPVEAGSGDLKELSQGFQRPVFYANDAMMSRFQIKYLPSLVFPGSGANEMRIGVSSFAQPFNAAAVLNSWTALRPVTTAKGGK